jgi:hypothetical protein
MKYRQLCRLNCIKKCILLKKDDDDLLKNINKTKKTKKIRIFNYKNNLRIVKII